jgi:hypothetical protein
MIAATATREEKQKWLMRPIEWASSVAWFSSTFGVVYYSFGLASDRLIIFALIAALVANSALLIWGISRMHRATR